MGLEIVKKSANLVGARIEVESAVGVGTTFRVSFPRSPSSWHS
jgi:signal transduction histidine kinase